MRNGIAAVQFGNEISLVRTIVWRLCTVPSAAPIRHQGGLAISGNSVLIGGNDCDYDAVVYQKNAAGSWAITGRIDDNQGECLGEFDSYAVEINDDYALLVGPYAGQAQAWRRNGSALAWIPAGVLSLLPEGSTATASFALQGATAVGPYGDVWRRSGTSTWTRQGEVTSVDHENSFGSVFSAGVPRWSARDPESGRWAFPRVYLETSPGRFEHVASLQTYENVTFHDHSGRTAVVAVERPLQHAVRGAGIQPARAVERARAHRERLRRPRRFRLHLQRRCVCAGDAWLDDVWRRTPAADSPSRC